MVFNLLASIHMETDFWPPIISVKCKRYHAFEGNHMSCQRTGSLARGTVPSFWQHRSGNRLNELDVDEFDKCEYCQLHLELGMCYNICYYSALCTIRIEESNRGFSVDVTHSPNRSETGGFYVRYVVQLSARDSAESPLRQDLAVNKEQVDFSGSLLLRL